MHTTHQDKPDQNSPPVDPKDAVELQLVEQEAEFPQFPERPWTFPWYLRPLMLIVGGVLVGLLVTAFMLKPAEAGLGTHQQLGLAPCSSRQWFGVRCPSCGMTTSWSYMTKGQALASFGANTGGAILAICAAIIGPWLIVSGLTGKWFFVRPNEVYFAIGGLTIVLITLVDWGYRLSIGS